MSVALFFLLPLILFCFVAFCCCVFRWSEQSSTHRYFSRHAAHFIRLYHDPCHSESFLCARIRERLSLFCTISLYAHRHNSFIKQVCGEKNCNNKMIGSCTDAMWGIWFIKPKKKRRKNTHSTQKYRQSYRCIDIFLLHLNGGLCLNVLHLNTCVWVTFGLFTMPPAQLSQFNQKTMWKKEQKIYRLKTKSHDKHKKWKLNNIYAPFKSVYALLNLV